MENCKICNQSIGSRNGMAKYCNECKSKSWKLNYKIWKSKKSQKR